MDVYCPNALPTPMKAPIESVISPVESPIDPKLLAQYKKYLAESKNKKDSAKNQGKPKCRLEDVK